MYMKKKKDKNQKKPQIIKVFGPPDAKIDFEIKDNPWSYDPDTTDDASPDGIDRWSYGPGDGPVFLSSEEIKIPPDQIRFHVRKKNKKNGKKKK